MCNLDRFIEGTIPIGLSIVEHTISDFLEAFHTVSISGLKLELLDMDVQHVCTFVPTLSSVYLMTKSQNNRSKIIEFHEDQPPFKRKPMSIALKDAVSPLESKESLSQVLYC